MRPKLQKKRNELKSKFGEGDTFTTNLNEVKYSTKELKANLVNINTLVKQVNVNWKNLNIQTEGIIGQLEQEVDDGMHDVKV